MSLKDNYLMDNTLCHIGSVKLKDGQKFILCISPYRKMVKSYMKKTRMLEKYEIDFQNIPTHEILYGSYSLLILKEKYGIVMTQRDDNIIQQRWIDYKASLLKITSDLQDINRPIRSISEIEKISDQIKKVIDQLNKLSKNEKLLSTLEKKFYRTNEIFKMKTQEYYHTVQYMNEISSLLQEYYRKISED